MTRTKVKVITKRLAFWETLIDCGCDAEPLRYLNYGETVLVLGNSMIFGGVMGDKEYCKVEHPIYGVGYMRKEGLEEIQGT